MPDLATGSWERVLMVKLRIIQLLLLSLVSFSGDLIAQTFPPIQQQMFWDGGRIVLVTEGSPKQLEMEGQERFNKKLVLPEDALYVDYFEGASWATRTLTEDGKRKVKLFRSTNFESWYQYAECSGEQTFGWPMGFYPLEGQRFLAVSGDRGFVKDKGASYWAIFKLETESGRLVFERLLSLDLKEPLVIARPAKAPAKGSRAEINPKYSTLAAITIQNPPIRTSFGLVLVGARPGFLWVLDPHTGDVRRRIDLIPGVDEAILGKPDELEWAILGCQPRMNGHLLVATRSPEAVTRSLKAFGHASKLEQLKSKKGFEKIQERMALALQAFPHVYWWDVNPQTGEIYPEIPPMNIPDKVWDMKILNKFRFRFKPNGNLLFGY